jgi:hypothetical protein
MSDGRTRTNWSNMTRVYGAFMIAILIILGLAMVNANRAEAMAPSTSSSSSCRSLVLNFITYGDTDKLTDYTNNSPDGCWGYNRLIQNTSTFETCSYPSGVLYGTGPNRVFDDTNLGNPQPDETNQLVACETRIGGNGFPGNSPMYAEYMGAYSSTCTISCWEENSAPGSGISIGRYYAETYSSNDRVGNLFSIWQNGTQSGVSPSTVAGVINITPFIYDYSNGLYHDWTALSNWIVKLCNATPTGGYLSVYSNQPGGAGTGVVKGTAEQTIINAMNSCD